MRNLSRSGATLWTPIRHMGFALLWGGQSISLFGDQLYDLALYWMALEAGSKPFLGFVAALTFLPRLLFSVWAGAIVDRSDPKRVMIITDLLRFAVVLLPVLVIGDGRLVALVSAAVLVPLFSSFFHPARSTMLPYLVEKEELVPANSLMQSSAQLAMVAGPGLAGALIAAVGIQHLFTLDALTFLVSACTLLLIAWPVAGYQKPAPQPRSQWRDTLEGLRYTLRTPQVRWLLILQAIDNGIGMGPVIVGLPILIKEHFAGGAAEYGYLMSAYGIGMLLGSLLLGMWGARLPKGKAILAGYALVGISVGSLGFAPTLGLALALGFVGGIFIALIVIPIPAAIQEIVPKPLLGRTFGILYAVGFGLTSFSVAMTGILANFISIPVLLLFAGVVFLSCALVGAFSPTMRRL